MLAVLCGLTFGLAACDPKEENGSAPKTLVGTSWISEAEDDGEEVMKTRLRFESKTAATTTLLVQDEETGEFDEEMTIPFTYSYDPPHVRITILFGAEPGRVDGNKMTFDDGEEVIVFTRE